MLHAAPHGFLSCDFVISRDGQPIAEVVVSWLRRRAEIRTGDAVCLVRRSSEMPRTLLLESDDHVLALARFPWKGSPSRLEIEAVGRKLEFKRDSTRMGRICAFDEHIQVGTIGRVSRIKQEVAIDLPDAIPVPEQVFLFLLWVGLARWPSKTVTVVQEFHGIAASVTVAVGALLLCLCLAGAVVVVGFPRDLSESLAEVLDPIYVMLGFDVFGLVAGFTVLLSWRKNRR